MIYNKTDKNSYVAEFIKKFTSFAEKSPILLSFVTDDLGVTIVHENSSLKYFYEWDPTIPVKSFIHHIKQDLSYNHYPRISREVEITRAPTEEEIADKIAKNEWTVDNVPETISYRKIETFKLDKFLAMKDEFVLIDEDTNKQYCYKMNGSGIYFLKNYRENKFKDPLTAGEEFFKKSTLVTELNNVV